MLLYGCEVAKGSRGRDFAARLEATLGRAVRASETVTGSTDEGGDWVFAYRTQHNFPPKAARTGETMARYPAVLAAPTASGSITPMALNDDAGPTQVFDGIDVSDADGDTT